MSMRLYLDNKDIANKLILILDNKLILGYTSLHMWNESGNIARLELGMYPGLLRIEDVDEEQLKDKLAKWNNVLSIEVMNGNIIDCIKYNGKRCTRIYDFDIKVYPKVDALQADVSFTQHILQQVSTSNLNELVIEH